MKETHSRGKSAMGGSKSKSKKSGKKPHRMEIRHGKSGGHIVTHHFAPQEDGMTPDPEEHVMPDQASLLQHIAENTQDQPAPQAPPADAGAAAAPAAPPPAAATPPPGM